KAVEAAKKAGLDEIVIQPFISGEIVYLDAEDELSHKIGNASIQYDEDGNITQKTIYVRDGNTYSKVQVSELDLIDVNPAQISSLALSLIPFSSLDDTNRSMIAARTQTQAVPLLKNESPIVGTGYESIAA